MVFKIHGGDNPFQSVGIPDLLCCFYGRFVGLEAKIPGNKPSAIQRATLRQIEAAGGIARVVYSVEDVDKALDDAMDHVGLAWIAGFFDGEGCITIRPSPFHDRGYVRLTITQKDPAPLVAIQKILGMGHLTKTRSNCHNLQIGRQPHVKRFFTTVGPFIRLRHRRLKVEEACDFMGIDRPNYYFHD
jgi:hypothetical protein